MEHTANYQLSQWEATDRIQMEDFNGDNAKVEAALLALTGRLDGRIYTGSYSGTGSSPRSLTFPRKPLVVAIGSSDGDFLLLFPTCAGRGLVNYPATGTISGLSCKVQGNTITWNAYCNTSGRSHQFFSILEA